MSAALLTPYLQAGVSTSPGKQPPGILRHERAAPNPPAQTNDEDWLGHGPIIGFQLPQTNNPRFLPPDPAEEQGVGRAPTMMYASYEEDLHRFDKYYMGVGVRHPEPHEYEQSLHQVQEFRALAERDFGGQWEEQNPDITTYNESATVPVRVAAQTLTRRRRG